MAGCRTFPSDQAAFCMPQHLWEMAGTKEFHRVQINLTYTLSAHLVTIIARWILGDLHPIAANTVAPSSLGTHPHLGLVTIISQNSYEN